jgi:hypothetical protein
VPTTNRIGLWFRTTVVLIVLCLLGGCSVQPVMTATVTGKNLQEQTDLPVIGPNQAGYEDTDSGSWNYSGRITDNVNPGIPCRSKYHPSYALNRWMVVEGRLDNGNKYPVVLDTGASVALFVNETHIAENKLAIHPPASDGGNSVDFGVCHLPKLYIGELTLADSSCIYRQQHAKVRLFGLPVAKDKAIIAGLPTLRKFKYIAFDSVREEVEFSLEKVFEPSKSDSWMQYPFIIEEGLGGNAYLFVKIPVAGEETELQLDTGSGRGLAIAEEQWEKISKKIPEVKLKKGKDLYPYIGQMPCRRGVVPKLEVGGRMVKDAMISVFPNDSPLIDEGRGLLGMQYFRDTVMVLDFERNLMWVKNSKAGG